MLRILRKLFLACMFAVAGVALYQWTQEVRSSPAPAVLGEATVTLPPASVNDVPSLTMLVVQTDAAGESKRVLKCTAQGCRVYPLPPALNDEALSDGESWYYYGTTENQQGEEVVALTRTWTDGGDGSTGSPQESDTIVQETTLVSPRGLTISADGTKLAYWLDNITNDDGFTEIWMYDSLEDGTRVLTENLVKPDVLSRLRWNRAGTALWFLANNAPKGEAEKRELVVVNTAPAGARVAFSSLDIEKTSGIIDHGVMDINAGADTLAYALPVSSNVSELVIIQDGHEPQTQVIRGYIPYLQWLEDGSLLYAVQNGNETIFWRGNNNKQNTPIARLTGALRSAQGDSAGGYIAFLAEPRPGELRAFALQVDTGLVRDQGEVPPFGRYSHLVYAQPAPDPIEAQAASVTAELTDEELLAFVVQHMDDIARQEETTPVRMVMTDSVNTLYVDYKVGEETELSRLLVTVKDAIHPEWSIRARYEPVGGEWQKVQGGGLQDPAAQRVYEWEERVERWILKQSL